MKINFVKSNGVLIPAMDDDKTKMSKHFAEGEVVAVTIKAKRNYKFLQKYWSLINLTFDNLPENFCLRLEGDFYIPIPSKEELHYQIKLKAGLYEKKPTWGGNVAINVKSIAFDKMDESEFSKFYDSVFDIVTKYFLVETKREEIEPILAGFY